MEKDHSHIFNAPYCYWLGEFERNGYNDSDFYAIYYNDKTNSIGCVEFATTRFPGGMDIGPLASRPAKGDILEKARQVLENVLAAMITHQDQTNADNPPLSAFTVHARMILTEDARKRAKGETPGYVVPKGSKVDVLGTPSAFGTFYAKGYNQPGRHNSNVYVRLLDGTHTYLPCSKLKLDCALLTNDEVRKLAKALSLKANWLQATPHGFDPNYCGWLSKGVKIDPTESDGQIVMIGKSHASILH